MIPTTLAKALIIISVYLKSRDETLIISISGIEIAREENGISKTGLIAR